jgi:hypothetical protein
VGGGGGLEQLRAVPFTCWRQRQRRFRGAFERAGRCHARAQHVRVCGAAECGRNVHAGIQHRASSPVACSPSARTELAVQVLCTRDMLQHCDVVLMLDNDSLLKQAAAKQLKSAAASPAAAGGGGGGTAASVGMTLSDANKVPPQILHFATENRFHLTPTRLQRLLWSTSCATPWPCR